MNFFIRCYKSKKTLYKKLDLVFAFSRDDVLFDQTELQCMLKIFR